MPERSQVQSPRVKARGVDGIDRFAHEHLWGLKQAFHQLTPPGKGQPYKQFPISEFKHTAATDSPATVRGSLTPWGMARSPKGVTRNSKGNFEVWCPLTSVLWGREADF